MTKVAAVTLLALMLHAIGVAQSHATTPPCEAGSAAGCVAYPWAPDSGPSPI
jgi:hypothetical protein